MTLPNFSNQYNEIFISNSPLSGIPNFNITSKAEIRSVVEKRRYDGEDSGCGVYIMHFQEDVIVIIATHLSIVAPRSQGIRKIVEIFGSRTCESRVFPD